MEECDVTLLLNLTATSYLDVFINGQLVSNSNDIPHSFENVSKSLLQNIAASIDHIGNGTSDGGAPIAENGFVPAVTINVPNFQVDFVDQLPLPTKPPG